jgi:EAL domain-containing protein (putative c-di-GMP-specific phosphodiesterase class I)
MTVVAEGIQNEEQRATLLKLGCEIGQGFLFSKPVAAEAAERALAGEISAPKLALA